jgi:RNA polymerase sigma-70 factor (ECF subfamily)
MTRHAVTASAVPTDDQDALVAAVRSGDEAAFALVVERYGRELQAHCTRMLGSTPEAEDVVQETFLRAWRARSRFEGRATLRTWLYRIATNACLDAREGRARRGVGPVGLPGDATGPTAGRHPLELVAPSEEQPDAALVARESVTHALLTTIEVLPARQREVLILRDVFGWSAVDSASFLATSVPAANSALQRARATMQATRAQRPAPSGDGGRAAAPSGRRGMLLRCLVRAHEQADGAAAALLARAAG